MQVNVGDILTSCAVLVALVTWWVTYRQARRSERVARTAEVIANLSVSEPLAEATYQVTRLINNGERVLYNSVDESTERNVVKILDYYEYMCDLYESGVLSRETIASLRGNLMARTYVTCEDYILESRKRQGRQLYAAFERFVKGLPGAHDLKPASAGLPAAPDPPGPSSSPAGSPAMLQSAGGPGSHETSRTLRSASMVRGLRRLRSLHIRRP
jgi:hypothetical protein